jgi:hypothetical protein
VGPLIHVLGTPGKARNNDRLIINNLRVMDRFVEMGTRGVHEASDIELVLSDATLGSDLSPSQRGR